MELISRESCIIAMKVLYSLLSDFTSKNVFDSPNSYQFKHRQQFKLVHAADEDTE